MTEVNKVMAKELVSYFANTLRDEYLDLCYEGFKNSIINQHIIESIQVAMPDYNGDNELVLKHLTTELDDSAEAIDTIIEFWRDDNFQNEIIKLVKEL
jgi:hypothetical protein